MAGMIRKLIASGVAAKLVQEARKPQNQAKIKKMIADFQRAMRSVVPLPRVGRSWSTNSLTALRAPQSVPRAPGGIGAVCHG